jgi:hypothetical protein
MLNMCTNADLAVIYFGLKNLKCVGCKMEETHPISVSGTEFEVESVRQKKKKLSISPYL